MFGFFSRKKKPKSIFTQAGKKNAQENSAGAYAAVKIYTRKSLSCRPVKRLFKQVFLCNEAPIVPLDNCIYRSECGCRYRHLPDRRNDTRRDADHGFRDTHVGLNRRAKNDRRAANDKQIQGFKKQS